MIKFKKVITSSLIGISTIYLMGCNTNSNEIAAPPTSEPSTITPASEQTTGDGDTNQALENENTQAESEIVAPSKEEVLAMRALVLAEMSQEEIDRLTENIKIANLQMEEGYLYDNLFGKLDDENHLYWNYFDEKGEIQIGWKYDGSFSDINALCEKENLTIEEFYTKYGTPVMTYNRFDANNFIELLNDMKNSVHNQNLQNDIQYIIDETKLASETHEMEHANNIYKALHDMDYFLLRYGIEDVGKYTEDASIASKYYGVLSVYSK